MAAKDVTRQWLMSLREQNHSQLRTADRAHSLKYWFVHSVALHLEEQRTQPPFNVAYPLLRYVPGSEWLTYNELLYHSSLINEGVCICLCSHSRYSIHWRWYTKRCCDLSNMFYKWSCASPFCIGAGTLFLQNISFMLNVTMIIAFCIFSLKGTIN